MRTILLTAVGRSLIPTCVHWSSPALASSTRLPFSAVDKVLSFCSETNTVRSFSGPPAGRRPGVRAIPSRKSCATGSSLRRVDIVERLGGEDLFPELRSRDDHPSPAKLRKQDWSILASINITCGKREVSCWCQGLSVTIGCETSVA